MIIDLLSEFVLMSFDAKLASWIASIAVYFVEIPTAVEATPFQSWTWNLDKSFCSFRLVLHCLHSVITTGMIDHWHESLLVSYGEVKRWSSYKNIKQASYPTISKKVTRFLPDPERRKKSLASPLFQDCTGILWFPPRSTDKSFLFPEITNCFIL